MAKKKKASWAGWNPVAPGPLPPKYQNLLNSFLNQQVNAYAQPRQNAITGYTKALSGELGRIAPQIGAAYGQAQEAQGALDTALANRLQQQGQETAGGLEQALGAAGQSNLPAALTAQQAVGVGNASFAQGSASLSQLLGQGAAAQAYGAKLPGIAALGGLQASKLLQAQAQAQRPELQQQFMANELQKWIARTGLGMDQAQLGQQNQQFYAGLAADAASAQAKGAKDAAANQAKAKKEKAAVRDRAFDGAVNLATRLYKGGTSEPGLIPPGSGSSPTPPTGPKTPYSKAHRQVLVFLKAKLGRYGFTDAQIQKVALDAMQSAGYKPPTKKFSGDLSWLYGGV